MDNQSIEELRETVFMTQKLLDKDFEVIKAIVSYLSRHGQASGYQMRRVIKQSRSHSYFTKFLVDCGVLYKPKYQYFELGEAHADPIAYEIASRQFRNWYRTNHQQTTQWEQPNNYLTPSTAARLKPSPAGSPGTPTTIGLLPRRTRF